jgi:all-trans-retinol dehydrogenase (NAD+)
MSSSSYQAADIRYSKKEKKAYGIKILLLVLKSLLLSILEFFKWFIPRQPKIIAGQLALVTGGSNGIGKAIAMSLAAKGCNIAIANRNHQEGIKTAIEIEEKFGVKAKAFKVDVSKHEDVKKLKAEVESSLGCVDILVNNAGYLTLKFSLLEGDDEEIQQVIDTNLTSYFWVCWKQLIRRDESLVKFQFLDYSSFPPWHD